MGKERGKLGDERKHTSLGVKDRKAQGSQWAQRRLSSCFVLLLGQKSKDSIFRWMLQRPGRVLGSAAGDRSLRSQLEGGNVHGM